MLLNPQMNIKIYVSPENHWCNELKTWLKKKRYPFELHDLDESTTARDELLRKSNQMAIPMIDIDGEIVIGFHPEKIETIIISRKSWNKTNN